MSSRLIGCADY